MPVSAETPINDEQFEVRVSNGHASRRRTPPHERKLDGAVLRLRHGGNQTCRLVNMRLSGWNFRRTRPDLRCQTDK